MSRPPFRLAGHVRDTTTRNVLGEPVLCFVSHEDCEVVVVREISDLPHGTQVLHLPAHELFDRDVLESVYY